MHLTKLTLLTITLCVTNLVFSQSPAAYEKAAKKANEYADYFSAMKYYEKILTNDSLKQTALLGYAESAVSFNALEQAEAAFTKIVTQSNGNADANVVLRLAGVKYNLGKYEEAMTLYQSIADKGTAVDSTVLETANAGVRNCNWATDVMDDSDLDLKVVNMGEGINTPYSEFAPLLFHDTLYFSSYRFPFENDKHNPQRFLVKVLTNEQNGPAKETTTLNINDNDLHTAHTAINERGTVMIYTLCRYINYADMNCDLYMRRRMADGSWDMPMKLPEPVNRLGYTTTEPNIGTDKVNNKELLFFASNRPGGKGQRDLYVSEISSEGVFSDPVNLDALNTVGEDVTPFYHSGTSTLYFSTDGRKSLGGMDIYKSQLTAAGWDTPEHLPHPLNTNRNDVYFVMTSDGSQAYLASNRNGAQYISEEACCYDIFTAEMQKPEMVAVTFQKQSLDSLNGTVLRLIEVSGSNEEYKIAVAGNHYKFPLQKDKQYLLIAEKTDYSRDTVTFSTASDTWKGLMVQHLFLQPEKINLVAYAFEEGTKLPLVGTECVFVDLGYILPNGKMATERVGNFPRGPQLNAVANDFKFALDFNHKYKVLIQKNGYTVDSTEVTTQGLTTTQTLYRNLYLHKGGLNLEAYAFNKLTGEGLSGTTIRFTELTGSRLESSTNEASNKYGYWLDHSKYYKVVISKPGFFPDSVNVSTMGYNSIDVKTLIEKLYLVPEKLDEFLPLRLYFDNDEPNKRTLSRTTNKTYEQTFNAYYPRKQEFVGRYLAKTEGANQTMDQSKIESFFENDLNSGYKKLMAFSQVLQHRLNLNQKITIKVKGFASPRAEFNYNLRLGSRRIQSLKNHFNTYNNGVFVKYLRSGALKIMEEPIGEQPVPVSDDIKDERNSVFSVEASLERRVEIIEVEIRN